jgi:spectinomycin phosphotransferase
MFIGGHIGGFSGDMAEESSFYQGYGDVHTDPVALAYYRYERIITDIAEFGGQVWDCPDVSAEACDRIACWVDSCFLPGYELEAARRADDRLYESRGVE